VHTDVSRTTYILAHIGLADEELCAQILFYHNLMVCERDGAYAGQDEVLGDFVGKGLDGDEQDVGCAHSMSVSSSYRSKRRHVSLLLRLDAPQANLSVVESDFICR
jgi:hypothetical protein